ncbi:putative reticulocyte-binding protein 2 like protein a [Lasiosphaeria hispida]|uniref:Reticulocyte-binding protein 2 like protein a n=1 Tax=Lasiosphaeria hispida TaxID=260671 RepID=A0AAJ0MGG6_9PEZI|nr:putative reticulocyte-binding protein 2 like protein a [Lasiosphaeria hispida]
MSQAPPPPPPHGENPRTTAGGSGLPPGKFDIFIIPEHSAGSGFLYLPSLKPQWNSFIAGVACTLAVVVIGNSLAPAMRVWWANFQGLGNMGMVLLVIAVGLGSWSLGRTQTEEPSNHGPGAGGSHQRPGAGFGSSGSYYNTPPPNGTPPPNQAPPPQSPPPPPQHETPRNERPNNSWQDQPQQEAPRPKPQPQAQQPPPPPPQQEQPKPQPKSQPKPQPQQKPQPAPPPQPSTAKPEAPKGAWEKAREETKRREEERREETKRREEERKAKEAAEKRKEDQARRLRELRERDAKERAERDRLAREKEAQEEARKVQFELDKTKLEKELRQKVEREIREKAEQEARARLEREREAREREQREREEERKREEERLRAEKERLVAREREANEARERKEKLERDRAEQEEKNNTRKGTAYAFSSVGEKTSMWPNGRPPAPSQAASSPGTAKPASPSPTKPAAKSAKSTAGAEEEAYSYRPYDTPKKPAARKKSVSDFSESSWAPSQSTARTSPPPSMRGPYTTEDPQKIMIKAVYVYLNQFSKTPASQLITGVGSVTDGLILRITSAGLFVDDDVRGVAQREWDVKAWTLKSVEVWCPTNALASTASSSPGAVPTNHPYFKKMPGTARRAAERGATKTFTGEEADAYLEEVGRGCQDVCRRGLSANRSSFSGSSNSNDKTGEWMSKGLHVLRATIRDQEEKRYLFIISDEQSWKIARGIQNLKGGTQARALGVAGISSLEARNILETLSWG